LTPPTSDVVPETPTAEGDDASSWGLPAAVTAGAVGAGALAMRNPQAAVKLAKTAARHVNDVRIGSMLSGLALPKSMLGNLGAATYAGIERGSLAPLKSLLSMQTVRDAAKSFKAGSGSANLGAPATAIARYNPITRAMGALDDATQAALVRSGVMHDADEVQGMLAKGVPLPTAMRTSASRAAARETLQAPLDPGMQKAMSGPVAQYMVPFRRTPFNQFTEGLQTLNPETKGQVAALATSLTTGGATGYTADDPKTIALGAAASGRYGLPFTMSAAVGRYLKTGNMRKAADAMQGVSPVSDYSLQGAVLEPMKVIPKPAAVGAYDYVKKLLGM
jgi:hypothetical protein